MNIPAIRLLSQQLINSKFPKVKDLVAHFGAMQAQDYSMSRWAVGIRIPGSTIQRKVLKQRDNRHA